MKGVFGHLGAPHLTQCELCTRSTATKTPPFFVFLFFLRKRLEVGQSVWSEHRGKVTSSGTEVFPQTLFGSLAICAEVLIQRAKVSLTEVRRTMGEMLFLCQSMVTVSFF